MTTTWNPPPDLMLDRLAALVQRCASSRKDRPARALLTRLALECLDRYPEISERALGQLVEEEAGAVRLRAALSLAGLLKRLNGVSRLRLVLEWALSNERRHRVAIARALRTRLPVVGVVAALEQLSHDEYADVRSAACRASAHRLDDGDDAFGEILREAAHDPRRAVRMTAISGLAAAAAHKPRPGQMLEALRECARDGEARSARRAHRALSELQAHLGS